MKNTPYIALTLLEELFSVINNQNVDLVYSNIVKTTWNFPSVHITLLKIGYNTAKKCILSVL